MILAEISVTPLGVGVSVGAHVKIALEAIHKKVPSVHVVPGAMGTALEAKTLKELLTAFQAAHEAVLRAGAPRVVTTLKIDERRDKPHTLQSKLDALRK